MTGTLVSQVGVFVLQIITKRYYFTPTEYGQLAYLVSICSIVITIAALRYDLTIMLPESDDQAKQIYRLARRSILVFSILTPLVCLLAFPMISAKYGNTVAQGLIFSGFYVFFTAELANIQFWYNRKSEYKTIAFNRALVAILTVALQIVFAQIGIGGMWGLVLGLFTGQGIGYFHLMIKAKELRMPIPAGTASKWWLMKRYRKMPLLGGPNALVDAVRLNGITLILGNESMATVGAYQTAWQCLQVPIGLINGAIGQVYLQKMSSVKRGELYPLVRFTTFKIGKWGIWPFVILYLIAPWFFPFLFGPAWTSTGDFARALTPWLFLQLLSSPISNIFVVTERQQILLGFAIVFAIVPLAELGLLDWTLLHRMQLMGLSMAIMLLIMIALAFQSAKIWDRGSPLPQP